MGQPCSMGVQALQLMPLSLDWCRPRTGCWIRVLRPMRLSSAATTVVVPGQITANLRITKAFGLGPLKGGSAASNKSPTLAASADPGGTAGAPSGRAIRNLLGSSASDRRYNLVVGSSARNILNHNNPGPIVGNINSPNSDRCHSSVRECRSKHCKKRLLFRSGSRNSQAVPALRRSGQPAIPRRDVQCIKQDQLLAC
jgi:hypothetical protein